MARMQEIEKGVARLFIEGLRMVRAWPEATCATWGSWAPIVAGMGACAKWGNLLTSGTHM